MFLVGITGEYIKIQVEAKSKSEAIKQAINEVENHIHEYNIIVAENVKKVKM